MENIELQRFDNLVRHITSVQQNARILGRKLFEIGEVDLAKRLVSESMSHDSNKFYGKEWEHLTLGAISIDNAEAIATVNYHREHNREHPEYHGKIQNMDKLSILLMICDCKSRANEFGTSVREWFETEALKRYNFSTEDEVYKTIMYFLNLLLEKPFIRQTYEHHLLCSAGPYIPVGSEDCVCNSIKSNKDETKVS